MKEWEKVGKTRFKAERFEEGEKITWKGERQVFSRIVVAVIALTWLSVWFLDSPYHIRKMTDQEPMFVNLLLFAWVAMGAILLLFAVAVFRGPREGMLMLGREFLIYKPGSPKAASWHMLSFSYPNWNVYDFLTGGKQLRFNKQDISQLSLGFVSGRLQLTFDNDGVAAEIGLYLDEIEKNGFLKRSMLGWVRDEIYIHRPQDFFVMQNQRFWRENAYIIMCLTILISIIHTCRLSLNQLFLIFVSFTYFRVDKDIPGKKYEVIYFDRTKTIPGI